MNNEFLREGVCWMKRPAVDEAEHAVDDTTRSKVARVLSALEMPKQLLVMKDSNVRRNHGCWIAPTCAVAGYYGMAQDEAGVLAAASKMECCNMEEQDKVSRRVGCLCLAQYALVGGM
jgi:hypothetical protein